MSSLFGDLIGQVLGQALGTEHGPVGAAGVHREELSARFDVGAFPWRHAASCRCVVTVTQLCER